MNTIFHDKYINVDLTDWTAPLPQMFNFVVHSSFDIIKNSLLSSNLLISSDISTAQGRIRYLQVSEKGKELLDINPLSN